MNMKRLLLVWVMMLCLEIVAIAESDTISSFDFNFSESGDGFNRGTVLYLPDFTKIGDYWDLLAVSGGDDKAVFINNADDQKVICILYIDIFQRHSLSKKMEFR